MTDRAYDIFLFELNSRKEKNSKRMSREEELARKKREALTPIAQLLTRIMELGLIVEHADSAAKRPGMPQGKEERFTVREYDSSPTWAPGVSIFIDHPARLEIAIPNEGDIEEMGPVVISCASEHPDRGMLIQRYNSLPAAADTLARFLAKNTVRMEPLDSSEPANSATGTMGGTTASSSAPATQPTQAANQSAGSAATSPAANPGTTAPATPSAPPAAVQSTAVHGKAPGETQAAPEDAGKA